MAQITTVLEVSALSTQHGYIKGWETFQFKGEKRNRLWTVWTREIGDITEGDVITVNGELSTKTSTYVPKNATEAKVIVEHSLNDVAISMVSRKQPGMTQVRNAADILTQKTEAEKIDMPF
jgi:hypothetical protein